jgi:hypothetical protein
MWDYVERHLDFLMIIITCCVVVNILITLVFWKLKYLRHTFRFTWAFWSNLLSLISPVVSVILYLWTFMLNNASNVSQLNSAGSEMWHLWASLWPYLLLANLFSVLIILSSCLIFFHPIKYPFFILIRLFTLLCAIGSLIIVCFRFPDA